MSAAGARSAQLEVAARADANRPRLEEVRGFVNAHLVESA